MTLYAVEKTKMMFPSCDYCERNIWYTCRRCFSKDNRHRPYQSSYYKYFIGIKDASNAFRLLDYSYEGGDMCYCMEHVVSKRIIKLREFSCRKLTPLEELVIETKPPEPYFDYDEIREQIARLQLTRHMLKSKSKRINRYLQRGK